MSSLGKLDDVYNTIVNLITAAINPIVGTVIAPSIPPSPAVDITVRPGQVFKGFPLSTELVSIVDQSAGQWQVSVFALPAKGAQKFRPIGFSTPPTNEIASATAVVDSHTQTITFSGTPTRAYSVNCVIGFIDDANIAVAANETPTQMATAMASAINALALSGVSATSALGVTTVSGPVPIVCNVGGTGTLATEVMRVSRLIQVSIWASDPDTRELLYEAIIQNVGIVTAECIALSDNAPLRLKYAGDRFDDDSQSAFTLYVCHLTFTAEYGIIQSSTGYQIGAVEAVQQVGPVLNPITTYNGN